MNCREFSDYAVELARARMMEAATRRGALRHAEACETCALRLRSEQSLTAALRATVESMDGVAAPPRVESALLAAFRESRDGGRAPAPASLAESPAAARVSAARFAGWRWRALAASAVAAMLLLAFTVARRAQFANPSDTSGEVASSSSPSAVPGPGEAVEATRNQSAPSPAPASENVSTVVKDGGPDKPSRVERAAAQRSRKRAMPQQLASFEVDGGRAVLGDEAGGEIATAGANTVAADSEALTDFVPVAAGSNSAPLDGGQLVRVKVPRAALASLGLPVDADRADGMVKADVLLGHDGTARAIRLVR